MARRSRRPPIVPEASGALDALKVQVMNMQGYRIENGSPENVKYEVAKSMAIPLRQGYNGQLSTEQAGRVGGKIGGAMVREMIRIAKNNL